MNITLWFNSWPCYLYYDYLFTLWFTPQFSVYQLRTLTGMSNSPHLVLAVIYLLHFLTLSIYLIQFTCLKVTCHFYLNTWAVGIRVRNLDDTIFCTSKAGTKWKTWKKYNMLCDKGCVVWWFLFLDKPPPNTMYWCSWYINTNNLLNPQWRHKPSPHTHTETTSCHTISPFHTSDAVIHAN